MKETVNIKINQLPSKTWHWLKLNETNFAWTDDIEEESNVINGRGFAIWDGFKEFQDYYYQSMELFKEYVKANDMNLSDFPVDEDLDIIELNKVLEDNFEELKDVYEGE